MAVNLIGCLVFSGLFVWDKSQEERRVERRRVVREKQVRGTGPGMRTASCMACGDTGI